MKRNLLKARYEVLLRDFDYKYESGLLIQKAIPGWCGEQIKGKFSHIQIAVESLLPFLDDEFRRRASDISKGIKPKAFFNA